MTIDHIHGDIGLMVGLRQRFLHHADAPAAVVGLPARQRPDARVPVPADDAAGALAPGQPHPAGGCLRARSTSEQFVPIMNVFPDATFIVTHHDPVDVSVSMATMMTYTMRMSVDVVDVPTVAGYWIGRIEEMLNACLRDHDKLPPERTIDVRFDEFMADDLGHDPAGGTSPDMCRRTSPVKPSPATWPGTPVGGWARSTTVRRISGWIATICGAGSRLTWSVSSTCRALHSARR